MPYYLGIDGGGTKTTSAVGDDRQILATATAGASNVVRVGEKQARESLQRSVRQACAAAGITPTEIERTCLGGSGAARPELAAILRDALAEILTTPIAVVGDMEIALEAAFDDGPGVVVIAGTGSIAYGRDRDGHTVRAGGWGFEIGDEGSAHWIGRMAINAILRASDRKTNQTHAEFEKALMSIWGVSSLIDLARTANSIPPPDFAALFPAVAASDDSLATEILSRTGRELADLAAVVIQRLFSESNTASGCQAVKEAPVLVAMVGGVFRHSQLVREVFYNEVRKIDVRVEVNPQVVDPVEGALHLARKAAL